MTPDLAPERAGSTPVPQRVLALALALGVPLLLWEGRGTIFDNDELAVFEASRGYALDDLLHPHNGHLVLIARIAYQGVLDSAGPNYLILRAIGLIGVALCAIALFTLIRRRVDPVVALVAPLLVLFLGSSWTVILTPFDSLVWAYPIAAGLGALIALERRARWTDLAACGALGLAVGAGSVGLVFLIGATVSVLWRDDRWRGLWVVVVPAMLYLAWWIWASRFDQHQVELANVLVLPNFLVNSAAAAMAALAGLDSDLGAPMHVEPEWGRPIALVAMGALALRLSRGPGTSHLWISLTVVVVYWMSTALVFAPGRSPEETRYLFAGAVGILMVATAAVEGVRFGRRGTAAVIVVTVIAVLGNLYQLHTAGASLRDSYAKNVRSQLAMLELARNHVPADFSPAIDTPEVSHSFLISRAGPYLDAVARFGSPAFAVQEVRDQPDAVRQGADFVLAAALGVRFEAVTTDPEGCRHSSAAKSRYGVQLPVGGAILRVEGKEDTRPSLRRFADESSVSPGVVSPNNFTALRIPEDGVFDPWVISVPSGRLTVCELADDG